LILFTLPKLSFYVHLTQKIKLTFIKYKQSGESVLHFAAQHGAPSDVIIALVSAGANVNDKDSSDYTPAARAKQYNHHDIAKLLESCCSTTKSAKFMA
jgi:hypothetical protein